MSWENYIKRHPDFNLSDEQIIKYFIKRDDLKSHNRKRNVVYKRFYLMYKYCYSEKYITLEQVGRAFGRNHASVLNALTKWDIYKNYKDVQETIKEYKTAFITKTI